MSKYFHFTLEFRAWLYLLQTLSSYLHKYSRDSRIWQNAISCHCRGRAGNWHWGVNHSIDPLMILMMIQHLKERAVTVNNVHINPPLHNQELFLVDHTKCYVVKMQIKLPLADVLSFENSWNLFFLNAIWFQQLYIFSEDVWIIRLEETIHCFSKGSDPHDLAS